MTSLFSARMLTTTETPFFFSSWLHYTANYYKIKHSGGAMKSYKTFGRKNTPEVQPAEPPGSR